MAGAVPMTSLGVGFTVPKGRSTYLLKQAHNGNWYVCRRGAKQSTWAEIIAEFKFRSGAVLYWKWLREAL